MSPPPAPPVQAPVSSPRPRQIRINAGLAAAIAAAIGAALAVRFTAKDHPTHHFVPHVFLSPMALCFYTWLALSLYWNVSARGASAAKSAESPGSRRFHLLLITAAQLIDFWFYPGWPFLDGPRFAFPRVFPVPSYLAALGVVIAVAGLGFAIWSRRALGRNWSGEVTLKVDHQLIRSGPYRWIRHPIYTGAIAMYLGPALVSGRLQGLMALALVAIAYARKIRQEEAVLSEEFGTDYDEYRRHSWALIPGVF